MSSIAIQSQRRLSVDVQNDPVDRKCAQLVARGFSTALIMEETGLTFSQVLYTARKAQLPKRRDFRNGTSPFAREIIKAATPKHDPMLVRYLKAHY